MLTDNDEVIALAPGGVIVARRPRCWARHQTIVSRRDCAACPGPGAASARRCRGRTG
ncbi:hypothetical protein ACFWWT_45170 [Streptomyces sp. NPDC058676]|uniref:hypothetical protein n=1 Tax=unclassified Streptomyces TaxID=2593676 RepID=UPI00364B87C1